MMSLTVALGLLCMMSLTVALLMCSIQCIALLHYGSFEHILLAPKVLFCLCHWVSCVPWTGSGPIRDNYALRAVLQPRRLVVCWLLMLQ